MSNNKWYGWKYGAIQSGKYDEKGHVKKTGAQKRESDKALERFMKPAYSQKKQNDKEE